MSVMDESPITRYRAARNLTLEAFGRLLSLNKSTVLRWERAGVPVARVLDIERLTGISRHELRPDIFGPAPSEAAQVINTTAAVAAAPAPADPAGRDAARQGDCRPAVGGAPFGKGGQ